MYPSGSLGKIVSAALVASVLSFAYTLSTIVLPVALSTNLILPNFKYVMLTLISTSPLSGLKSKDPEVLLSANSPGLTGVGKSGKVAVPSPLSIAPTVLVVGTGVVVSTVEVVEVTAG